MITLTREEAQQVLDTMQHARVFVISREKIKQPEGSDLYDEIIELLRARLSAPEPEPVAFKIYKQTSPRLGIPDVKIDALPWVYDQDPSSGFVASMWVVPANSAPPQREITDDEFVTEAKKRGFFISAPQQREWQGLTDEEIEKLFMWQEWSEDFTEYEPVARAIEAKLRKKNT